MPQNPTSRLRLNQPQVLALSTKYSNDPKKKDKGKDQDKTVSIREAVLNELEASGNHVKTACSTLNYLIAAGNRSGKIIKGKQD